LSLSEAKVGNAAVRDSGERLGGGRERAERPELDGPGMCGRSGWVVDDIESRTFVSTVSPDGDSTRFLAFEIASASERCTFFLAATNSAEDDDGGDPGSNKPK
jgi:hypothetical protein